MPEGGRSRSVAAGAAWNYGAQIATVVAQLGYAAVSSRLLPASSFGEYGVALTVAALVGMLAVAGVPQAVARLTELDRGRVTGLLWYALLIGVAGAVLLFLTADFWAGLWGVPGSAPVLRLLAVGSLFSPVFAFGSGLLVRLGRFRTLALTTFGANLIGMAVGIMFIAVFRTAPMLVVSVIVSQAVAAAVILLRTRRLYGRGVPWSVITGTAAFGGRSTVSSLLAYAAGNAGKFTMSNAFGAVLLGHWNRADVITTTPMYQIQNALAGALYPEFRHDDERADRARRVWADLLGLMAWICLPIAAVLAALAGPLVPIVFGRGWSVLGEFVPALAVIGAVQAVAFVLVGALEVQARFRWIWAGHVVALAVNAAGALVALAVGNVQPALIGVIVGLSGMHAVHVVLCHRAGLIRAGALLRHYLQAAAFSAGIAVVLLLLIELPVLASARPLLVVPVVIALVGALVGAVRFHHRLSAFALARAYGLLPSPFGRYLDQRTQRYAAR